MEKTKFSTAKCKNHNLQRMSEEFSLLMALCKEANIGNAVENMAGSMLWIQRKYPLK
ncbi:hypothetical protein [Butyrivibrio sp. FCS006]|uniref:hypothetical protein n=1 Tax=Butyrivibrio sp. FCS006 TaxID=1280684 RepID=UPI0012DD2590|nr:hypothetical protein [Butyrivibrio sp. FCS006]